jgi:hypothetical protein
LVLSSSLLLLLLLLLLLSLSLPLLLLLLALALAVLLAAASAGTLQLLETCSSVVLGLSRRRIVSMVCNGTQSKDASSMTAAAAGYSLHGTSHVVFADVRRA